MSGARRIAKDDLTTTRWRIGRLPRANQTNVGNLISLWQKRCLWVDVSTDQAVDKFIDAGFGGVAAQEKRVPYEFARRGNEQHLLSRRRVDSVVALAVNTEARRSQVDLRTQELCHLRTLLSNGSRE